MRIKLNNHEMTLSGTGQNLGSVLLAAGIPIDMRCSGKGICNRCKVILHQGHFEVEGEEIFVKDTPLPAKSCRTTVLAEDAVIEIPRKSLAGNAPKCAEAFHLQNFKLSPVFSGVAAVIDIGTTTVAVALIDSTSGKVIGNCSDYNKQFKYGDNVVSRISFSTEKQGNLELLRRVLIDENIDPMLKGLCFAHDIDKNQIQYISVAGNTVMTHILWGLSIAGMGAIPFEPETLVFEPAPARNFGITSAPEAIVKAVPAISGYIGGDITAGLISSGIEDSQKCSLLVDVGTNCETVLLHKGQFYACASAAGPAFEGAGVECGSRGEQGAIEKIRIDKDSNIEFDVIGNCDPHGICGSGMIDFLAEARACGLLNEMGRFDIDLLKKSGRYLKLPENITACKITQDGKIYMSEKDIESILKAKAAIFSGIKSLTTLESCDCVELDRIYLAGGFASYIDIANAIKIGMLPDMPLDKFIKIGNSSLAGAALHILSKEAHNEYLRIISQVKNVILNELPEFEMNYIEALFLP